MRAFLAQLDKKHVKIFAIPFSAKYSTKDLLDKSRCCLKTLPSICETFTSTLSCPKGILLNICPVKKSGLFGHLRCLPSAAAGFFLILYNYFDTIVVRYFINFAYLTHLYVIYI